MKIPKSIREMPWPEQFTGNPLQQFKVEVRFMVAEHERFMVVTFLWNRHKKAHYNHRTDFRMVCSKKQPAAALQKKGNSRGQRMCPSEYAGSGCGVHWPTTYPEIAADQEAKMAAWIGARNTGNHYMVELDNWCRKAIWTENQKERDARGELRDQDVSLCPEALPAGLEEFIRRTVLPDDATLIYKNGNVRGTCYQCGQKVRAHLQRFRQNEVVRCPSCGKIVTCYREGSDRFKVDYVQNVATLQKGADGKTVFFRQWHLLRDETAQWENIPAQLQEVCRYAVRGDKLAKWVREVKTSWYMKSWREGLNDWTRMQDAKYIYDGCYAFYLPPDWQTAVAGTSLAYIELDAYMSAPFENRNVVRFAMEWAQYPSIEKLWKAGYRMVANEKATGLRKENKDVIRWRKGVYREMFRFPTRLLKIWQPMEWDAEKMRRVAVLWSYAEDGKIPENEIPEAARINADIGHIMIALRYSTAHRILKYLRAQKEEFDREEQARKAAAKEKGNTYWSAEWRTSDYRDYLTECQVLGLDLNERAVLFPKNLKAAHARTISQVKYRADELKREKFTQEVQKLQKLCFEKDGLLIRPASSAEELIAEGKILRHCVGGYADRMADGKTAILLIRRVSEPDKPFYTMEWLNGQVQQCRTVQNRSYVNDPEVAAFVQAWKDHIRKAKRKIKKAAAVA